MQVQYCNEIYLWSLLTLNQISSLIFFNLNMTGLLYFSKNKIQIFHWNRCKIQRIPDGFTSWNY